MLRYSNLQLVVIGIPDGNTSILTLGKLIYVSDFRNIFINFARPTWEPTRFNYFSLNKIARKRYKWSKITD